MGGCLTGCDSCPSKGSCKGGGNQEKYSETQMRFKDKKVLCVISGKGGVGKSTLAYAVARELSANYPITLIDADIAGPSIPRMTGTDRSIEVGGSLIAQEIDNLQIITPPESLISEEEHTPGLSMLHYLSMINTDSKVLIIDTPPGTSDVHITLVKCIPHMQALLVTTGHSLSLSDTARSVQFCSSAGIPIIGVIESMSKSSCQKCGSSISIFPSSLVETFCKERNLCLLQSVPLLQSIAQLSDCGKPPKVLNNPTVQEIHKRIWKNESI